MGRKGKSLYIIMMLLVIFIGCGNNVEEISTEVTDETMVEMQTESETVIQYEEETEGVVEVEEITESTEIKENITSENNTDLQDEEIEELQNNSSSSGLTWYDEEGFYYCMTSSRDWYDDAGVHTYYTGYVLAPNTKFKILVEDYALEHEVTELKKKLANAGYDNIVRDDSTGDYCILIQNADEQGVFDVYVEQLIALAQSQQMAITGIGGGYINILDTNGNHVYLISTSSY